jgi:hypothetical protein
MKKIEKRRYRIATECGITLTVLTKIIEEETKQNSFVLVKKKIGK